jgi:hypothetical protein
VCTDRVIQPTLLFCTVNYIVHSSERVRTGANAYCRTSEESSWDKCSGVTWVSRDICEVAICNSKGVGYEGVPQDSLSIPRDMGLPERRRNRIYETLCHSDWKQEADIRTRVKSHETKRRKHINTHSSILMHSQPNARRFDLLLKRETKQLQASLAQQMHLSRIWKSV